MRIARLILAHALDFIDDRIIGHRLYPWFCNICYDVWPDSIGHSCWMCDKMEWSA